MLHPEALIDFKVYEDKNEYLGIAQVGLPNIAYITQKLTGAGIAGNIEAVLIGMVDVMTTTMQFRNCTDAAAKLAQPVAHQIDLRVAEQYWDSVGGQRTVQADKYVLKIVPKSFTPGNVTPASPADANGEYSTYYYAAYKDGKQLWEIDPHNYICRINGVDYMEPVRKALGK
jgi:P2 family phage contractile tail tube protein